MVRNKKKGERMTALLLAAAMIIAFAVPTITFASGEGAEAVAMTVRDKENDGWIKKIAVTFDDMVVFGENIESGITVSSGDAERELGENFSVEINEYTQKDMTIILGADSDVAVGDEISFAEGAVMNLDQTESFGSSVTIAGSFEPVAVRFEISAADGAAETEGLKVTVDGYEVLPEVLGIGEYTYTVSANNYKDAVGEFDVTAADFAVGEKTVNVTIEPKEADKTNLDSLIGEAEAINADDYSLESAKKLSDALDAAKEIWEKEMTITEQDEVDNAKKVLEDALNGLVRSRQVPFIAVAVSTDVNESYGKANKIMLVFSEPVNGDISQNLSVKESASEQKWADGKSTVYEITLAEGAQLANGSEIEYTENSDVKTLDGEVVKSFSTDIKGDLEGAAEYVTANGMSATVVKASAKPGVNEGDKIVVVFNAPLFGSEDTAEFTVNGLTLCGSAVEGTSNTVYEIILEGGEDIDAAAVIACEDISTSLDGSFGSAQSPKVLRAYAEDVDGTYLAAGDRIVIVFDIPTNGKEITSTELRDKCLVTGIPGASLGNNSTAVWEEDNTKLVITVGDTAIVGKGIKLNIQELGIKDMYDTADVCTDGGSNEIAVDGSFGYTIQPVITKAVAFTLNGLDYIRVYFNVRVQENGEVNFTISDFNPGANCAAKIVDEGGITYYQIVMDKEEHTLFESGKHSISITSGLADAETGTMSVSSAAVTISGAFVAPTVPEPVSVTAVCRDGSGKAREGDRIIAVFNIDVEIPEKDAVTAINGSLGSDYAIGYAQNAKNVLEITLGGDDIDVVPGKTSLVFEGITDYDTKSAASEKAEMTVKGAFGYAIDAEILSVTAVSDSKNGHGFAQKDDRIIIVFNRAVTDVQTDFGEAKASAGGCVWTLTLSEDNPELRIGSSFVVSYNDGSDVKSSVKIEKILSGSFGYSEEAALLSATAVSANGYGSARAGDKIILVFNTAVSSVKEVNKAAGLGEPRCDGNDRCVWTITLTGNPVIDIGDALTFTVVNEATGEQSDVTAVLGGSFGYSESPKVLSATAVSANGCGAAKAGDRIIIVFNTAVTGVALKGAKTADGDEIDTDKFSVTGVDKDGFVWSLELKEDGSIALGDTLTLEAESKLNGEKLSGDSADAVLGGSFGYSLDVAIRSAILSEGAQGSEMITVVFSTATNGNEIDIAKLQAQNEKLGTIESAEWDESGCVLKITFRGGSTEFSVSVEKDDILDLTGLGIAEKNTGKEPEQKALKCKIQGSLIPVVTGLRAESQTVIITFSARTNGKASLMNYRTLFGIGATTSWSEDKKELRIKLGENYSLTIGGYIVLNGMGIKDGFSGEYNLVGQYKLNEGNLDGNTLTVRSATAQSNDKGKTTAQAGDNIVITFNSATNANGAELNRLLTQEEVDEIVECEIGNEEAFGTGYSGMWTNYETFVITLGGAAQAEDEAVIKESPTDEPEEDVTEAVKEPQIETGSSITVKGVCLASGDGQMKATTLVLKGGFDGRTFAVTNVTVTRTNGDKGDYVVSADITNTFGVDQVPLIMCEAYSDEKLTNVVDVSSVQVYITDTVSPKFIIPASSKIAGVKIYVFSDNFYDDPAVNDKTKLPESYAEKAVLLTAGNEG